MRMLLLHPVVTVLLLMLLLQQQVLVVAAAADVSSSLPSPTVAPALSLRGLHPASAPVPEEYKKIFTYEPFSPVEDHAILDRDQALIESELALGTAAGRNNALDVYRLGANSKSYSLLTLDIPLFLALEKGTSIYGYTQNGIEIQGVLRRFVGEGTRVIAVEYDVPNNCKVGGNPRPVLDGCFASTGKIEIENTGEFRYEYLPLESNLNKRSLYSVGSLTEERMYTCIEGCPYEEYTKFYKYYGVHDYSRRWIENAFNGRRTFFIRGNADFGSYNLPGKSECITIASAHITNWMYIIADMEKAIYTCDPECCEPFCDADNGRKCPTDAWDEALAHYVGSTPSPSNSTAGHFSWTLAETMCSLFGTCGTEYSTINEEALEEFIQGEKWLGKGHCDRAEKNKDRLVQLMRIPLLQGLLISAWEMRFSSSETEKARGATFAAAVLPLIHDCSQNDASVIYNNMRVGAPDKVDFFAVKNALERNYACLEIGCGEIGGILDPIQQTYLEGTAPCTVYEQPPRSRSSRGGEEPLLTRSSNMSASDRQTVLIFVGVIVFCAILSLVVTKLSRGGPNSEVLLGQLSESKASSSRGGDSKIDATVTTEELQQSQRSCSMHNTLIPPIRLDGIYLDHSVRNHDDDVDTDEE